MEHYNELKELLKTAIGERTKKDFAAAAGLSQEYLTRAMKEGPINRPSRSTLKKIMLASEGRVSYTELLSACGYDASEEKNGAELSERKSLSYMERASKCAYELKEGFLKLGSNRQIYESLNDYIELVDLLYGVEKISFEVGEERDFGDRNHKNADGSVVIRATWGTEEFTARTELLVWFARLVNGALVIIDTEFSKSALEQAGSELVRRGSYRTETEHCTAVCGEKIVYSVATPIRKEHAFSKADEAAYLRRIKAFKQRGMSDKDAFLAALLGDPERRKRIMSVEGEGFYLDGVSEYIVREFLLRHHETFNRSEEEAKILDGLQNDEDFSSLFAAYQCDADLPDRGGFEVAICNVIRRETGIDVHIWGTMETERERSRFGNRPVLMLEAGMPWEFQGAEKTMTGDEVRAALDAYAKELRLVEAPVYYLMEVDLDEDDVL